MWTTIRTDWWMIWSRLKVVGFFVMLLFIKGRRGGLVVSALDSGAGGAGSNPSRGHCVVFLGKTLYSHSASLYPSV